MNSVNLIGRLTKDPELKHVGENDRPVCDMRLAVNDGREDRDPCYIDVSTFDAQAEACANYLAKGREVAVSGRLVYREWEHEGSKRSKHSVIGRVQFLGGKKSDEAPDGDPVAVGAGDEEDIPF